MRVLIVRLLDTETGQTQDTTHDYPDDCSDEGIEFMWNEGNCSCDCNRALFWARETGGPESDSDCAGTRYAVVSVTENGRPFPLKIR